MLALESTVDNTQLINRALSAVWQLLHMLLLLLPPPQLLLPPLPTTHATKSAKIYSPQIVNALQLPLPQLLQGEGGGGGGSQ